jgi:hypothetical protein
MEDNKDDDYYEKLRLEMENVYNRKKMVGEICSICFVDKEDKQLQKHTLKNGKTIFLCNKCSMIIP